MNKQVSLNNCSLLDKKEYEFSALAVRSHSDYVPPKGLFQDPPAVLNDRYYGGIL